MPDELAELRAAADCLQTASDLITALRDTTAMLNAAIRIVRPLDILVGDSIELRTEQVKSNMALIAHLEK